MNKETEQKYAGMRKVFKAVQQLYGVASSQRNTTEVFDRDNGDELLKMLNDAKQAVFAEKARRDNTKIAKVVLQENVSLADLKEVAQQGSCHMSIMINQALYEGMYDLEDLQESARFVLEVGGRG